MPKTILFALACWAYLTKNEKRRKQLILTFSAVLFLFTNQFIINELFLLWEKPITPFATVKQYDVGIILTGFTNDGQELKDRTYLNQAADRIIHPIRLYKEGKIKNILICGAEYDMLQDSAKNRQLQRSSKDVLLYAGIPDSVIFIENASRNTRENALFAKKFLVPKFPKQTYLVITSAYHARRASACFEKVGLQVDTFSCDFLSQKRTFHVPFLLMPQEQALTYWAKFIHEVTGYIVYKIMGYA